MVRVGVLGAGGRMGQEVCRAVLGADDLELVAAVDPTVAGRALAELVAGADLEVAGDVGALAGAGAEVAVDFTVASAARRHLAWCAGHEVHAVVGTTGLGSDDLAAARGAFGGAAGPNAVVAANFAIGAVLLIRLCELAAPFMDGVEIIELHHDAKRDAPSGTAIETARRIADARREARERPLARGPDDGRDPARGPWGHRPRRGEDPRRPPPGPGGPRGGGLRGPRTDPLPPPRLHRPGLVHARGPARRPPGRLPPRAHRGPRTLLGF